MKIIKRSGEEVLFDKNKILNAISKANNEETVDYLRLSESQITAIADIVEKKCNSKKYAVNVEEIQDMVEDGIMQMRCYEVAKLYVKYRYKRELSRKANTTDESILSLIDLSNEDIKQENSNKNPTVASVQRDYMAGEVSKDITKRILLDEDIVAAHEAGIIHFHDADYFAQKIHNCFTGGTKFVTDKGIVPFMSFKDGDEVYVKDKDGILRLATVHKYGKQKMNKVIFKNNKMEHQVICTANHRWLLKDGTITTQLKEGDILAPTVDSTNYKIESYEDAKAFVLGFVVGDGTDCSTDASKVRLCGNKIKYLDIFKRAGWTVQKENSSENDVVVYKGKACKQNFLNGKAWRFMSVKDKVLAFHGLYAADGAINSNKLCTTDERVSLFIEETSCLAGYYISSVREEIRDTSYKKDSKLKAFHFIVSSPKNWLWKVDSIESYRHGEVDAWCVEEPITHTFTLEKGIVTGNCDLINLEDMLQNGTAISQTKIETPHSFYTACNITTQIVAQVASSQYGLL